jgi:hypothetical protein
MGSNVRARMLERGGGSGQGRQDDVLEFGRDRRPGRRWRSRVLLAGLALIAAVAVVVRTTDHPARTRADASPPPRPAPPIHVILAGHRLLGVKADWQLFARGTDDLVRIQLAQGRITWTYVPPLGTSSRAIAFVIGARESIIRPADLVPGYVVPDGGQARQLTGLLAGGGPLIPGPAGTGTAWVAPAPPGPPDLELITLNGHRSGPTIRFPSNGPQLLATATSDGRGDVLLTSGNSDSAAYDAGPGWYRQVPGTVIAVGPGNWLTVSCNALYRHCRDHLIDTANGKQRTFPGASGLQPTYLLWPPTGVIAPDGSYAAVPETERSGAMTVHLIDLRTGAVRDLGVRLSGQGSNQPPGVYPESMAWSPDSRWLFAATVGGRLVAINPRSGRAESLGVSPPPVDQVAIGGG